MQLIYATVCSHTATLIQHTIPKTSMYIQQIALHFTATLLYSRLVVVLLSFLYVVSLYSDPKNLIHFSNHFLPFLYYTLSFLVT